MTLRRSALAIVFSVLAWSADAQVASSGPLTSSERNTVETSRLNPAAMYRDAYCAQWTDGCTTCSRATASEEPICRQQSTDAECRSAPVQCRRALPTIGRVCLSFHDGCNSCNHTGPCTAKACGRRLPDRRLEPRPDNITCTVPRRPSYDDPDTISLDLTGNWRLTSPGGRHCEIVLSSPGLSLHHTCLDLPTPVRRIKASGVQGRTFTLKDVNDKAVLSFTVGDLDDLRGHDQSSGWRLTRLDPLPTLFRAFEGSWRLRIEGRAFYCTLFLVVRRWATESYTVVKPTTVTMTSHCLQPIYAEGYRDRSGRYVQRPAYLLPRWTRWDVHNGSVTLRDAVGRATIFRTGGEELAAELVRDGHPPLKASLLRLS